MTPDDWNILFSRLLSVVPEIILIIIFMAYEERRSIRREKSDADDKDRRTKETAALTSEWRDFLEQEREQRHNDNTQLALLLERNGINTSAIKDLLTQHDVWERQVQAQRRSYKDDNDTEKQNR